MKVRRKIKENRKSFFWYWKRFWGNYYRVYDSSNILVKEVLIYHKKIYLIEN